MQERDNEITDLIEAKREIEDAKIKLEKQINEMESRQLIERKLNIKLKASFHGERRRDIAEITEKPKERPLSNAR